MKIEWLNTDGTEAIVTRGWFHKQRAHVKRGKRPRPYLTIHGGYMVDAWVFASTENYVGWWTERALDGALERAHRKARARRARNREWVDVKELPAARVIEKDIV